ncbi:hypothetical protein GKIL_0128 [Gloeobacter kilaueensis JS1]|uniref:Uncharacterized protein n=1 Tax=Gloeobacter kilaueensis (strain ATCC BAA-2537 / CCAP 1431/1 / ULC 316 / JS1) TaxID=1183438 RepID=U5QFD4_GLOK1|nr:hypothetical protein GKIL_0128 [Gloeobacter kilaueensis JS1]
MFIIEDDNHAETQAGRFASFDEALAELQRRSCLPWNEPPNRAPCTSWRTCGRQYVIVECDTSVRPWEPIQSHTVLEISAAGVKWLSCEPR